MTHRGPFQPLPFCDSVHLLHILLVLSSFLSLLSAYEGEERKGTERTPSFLEKAKIILLPAENDSRILFSGLAIFSELTSKLWLIWEINCQSKKISKRQPKAFTPSAALLSSSLCSLSIQAVLSEISLATF